MPETPAGQEPLGGPLTLLDAAYAVVRRRRQVAALGIAVATLTAAWVLTRPRTYNSQASFTPTATRSPLGALGGLAAQFGVAVPTADGNQSPAFYADLLHSRAILEPLAALPVPDDAATPGPSVADALVSADVAAPLRVGAAVIALRRALAVSVDARTGIVRVTTSTRDPHLSAMLTDSALGLLNRFNVETRRSQAAAQRAFLDDRLASAATQLREAEEALSDFAKRNRGSLADAPELRTQQERLNRAVSLRSQVHASLAQSLEQAKLDEIRDTPLITIIERARVAPEPSPRGLLSRTLVALLLGLVFGAILAVIRSAAAVSMDRDHDVSDLLRHEWIAARQEVAAVFGLGRRRRSTG